MYQCERLFGIDEGLKIRALVEAATGEPCPCKQGSPCLLPEVEHQDEVAVLRPVALAVLRPVGRATSAG